jgi:hypothetical protein
MVLLFVALLASAMLFVPFDLERFARLAVNYSMVAGLVALVCLSFICVWAVWLLSISRWRVIVSSVRHTMSTSERVLTSDLSSRWAA